ncbi:transposase [Fructilactobacillus sanfranciscensis]|nr:transposase [Fructilactobacillus sanfranciscensis]POH20007.1 transposase [Fructilactobacillus sanfranciscensis]
MKNRSKRYSLEFKQSLVALFNDEKRSMSSISKEYGVTVSSISKWINDEKLVSVDDGKPITRKDFLKLKKEYEDLKEENEILKAAAIILGEK